MTTPYSPLQNGVAERVNRTLVELAQAMICGADLPEFLWEPTIAHTAYLRNRLFTKPVKTKLPMKPGIIVSQMLHTYESLGHWSGYCCKVNMSTGRSSKSKRCANVGFKDGPKAIKHYNIGT